MKAHAFDARVQAALDARRDPLEDDDVRAFLDAHPERLAGFAMLCETLRVLPATAPRRRVRRAPLLLATAAACAVALALGWRLGPADAAASGSTLLAGHLQEIRPRAHAAVQFSLRQQLLATTTTTFETYERRSQRR